ncbi:sensor histidine kinase [Streptomonospora litoralis]|uniref:Sensor histidine kinase DesK n=1 Tax=Streptomonospora litoralis TaxID=2498135 RepID=A0A4P6Q7A3_9ACTN|nr:Sensor histidine kinase DesK [Streptomonospora litoralis]
MSEQAQATQGRLRALNLNIVAASLSAVGALLVAIDATTWQEAAVLAVGLAAAVLAVSRGTADRIPRVALPCLIVTAAVWVVGVLVTDSGTASYGFAAAGSVVAYRLTRHRGAAVAGMAAFAAAVVAARLVATTGDVLDVLLRYVLVSAAVALVAVVLTTLNHVIVGLTAQLEQSRQREAELAVVRERMRFASDLHDIQGHTLHVVKLKTALARKLLGSDAERAEEELREVYDLVGDTITRTRELAYAQRRLNLSAELANAKNLLEAAGIGVRVDRDAEADPRVDEQLGQVLRESTTNILRHAQAEQVHITLTEAGITIANDGAQEGPLPELRGLATLKERITGSGGEMTVDQRNGRFRTVVAFPRIAADGDRRPAPVRGGDR